MWIVHPDLSLLYLLSAPGSGDPSEGVRHHRRSLYHTSETISRESSLDNITIHSHNTIHSYTAMERTSLMPTESRRSYNSPLRERQASLTQNDILDAFTALLENNRVDDITSREIAEAAGVSQPTLYRHFPDREALLHGITARIADRMYTSDGPLTPRDLDGMGPAIEARFVVSEDFPVEVRAEALLNADPRRYSDETRDVSELFLEAVTSGLPELDDGTRVRVAGLLRCLGSSQTWLRMREEFDVPGTESGPLVRWAIETLIEEIRDGSLPDIPLVAGSNERGS